MRDLTVSHRSGLNRRPHGEQHSATGGVSPSNRNLPPQLSDVQPEGAAKARAGIATDRNAPSEASCEPPSDLPHAAIIAELPLDDLTLKALARRLGVNARTLASRYERSATGPLKPHLDREWLGRVVARIRSGERLTAIGYAASASTQGFARKVKRLTGLTPVELRDALLDASDLDPALLATPSTCSTPAACLAVGQCAGRCWRVGA